MKIIELCKNDLCRRPFQVNRYANVTFSILEPGRIACPHCGMQHLGDSNSIFMTHALGTQEEADFMKRAAGHCA